MRARIPRGLSGEIEATALGAAMLGAVGAGLAPDVRNAAKRFLRVTRMFVPRVQSAHAYDEAYRQFVRLSKSYKQLRS